MRIPMKRASCSDLIHFQLQLSLISALQGYWLIGILDPLKLSYKFDPLPGGWWPQSASPALSKYFSLSNSLACDSFSMVGIALELCPFMSFSSYLKMRIEQLVCARPLVKLNSSFNVFLKGFDTSAYIACVAFHVI